jgi:hypothetical protein
MYHWGGLRHSGAPQTHSKSRRSGRGLGSGRGLERPWSRLRRGLLVVIVAVLSGRGLAVIAVYLFMSDVDHACE